MNIRRFINRLRYAYKSWLFINRIGKLSRSFHELNDAIDRANFATENFGRTWGEVVNEHYSKLHSDVEEAINEE